MLESQHSTAHVQGRQVAGSKWNKETAPLCNEQLSSGAPFLKILRMLEVHMSFKSNQIQSWKK